MHEKSLSERKYAIPEEQKELTFKRQEIKPIEEVKNQLFIGSEKQNNSIIAQTEKLQLFSEKESDFLIEEEEEIKKKGPLLS
ncbi:type VII secretion EssA family protein [Bacillus aquiflavi]|uniref:type VII secretion EssA family protein n=1 Tax=Bacillus aquiflavi TaxID=2672567 RepID=UPI003743D874